MVGEETDEDIKLQMAFLYINKCWFVSSTVKTGKKIWTWFELILMIHLATIFVNNSFQQASVGGGDPRQCRLKGEKEETWWVTPTFLPSALPKRSAMEGWMCGLSVSRSGGARTQLDRFGTGTGSIQALCCSICYAGRQTKCDDLRGWLCYTIGTSSF